MVVGFYKTLDDGIYENDNSLWNYYQICLIKRLVSREDKPKLNMTDLSKSFETILPEEVSTQHLIQLYVN